MVGQRVARKKNGPEDYLVSTYSGQYTKDTLRDLCRFVGLKESINILEACKSEPSVEDTSSTAFKTVAVASDKKLIYVNTERLKNMVIDKHETKPGIAQFIRGCDMAIRSCIKGQTERDILKPFDSRAQTQSELPGEVEMSIFIINYYLASIYSLPERQMIVDVIQQYLERGTLDKMTSDVAMSILTPRARHYQSIYSIISMSLQQCVSNKVLYTLKLDARRLSAIYVGALEGTL